MDGWLFASVVAAACALSYIPDALRWITSRARRIGASIDRANRSQRED